MQRKIRICQDPRKYGEPVLDRAPRKQLVHQVVNVPLFLGNTLFKQPFLFPGKPLKKLCEMKSGGVHGCRSSVPRQPPAECPKDDHPSKSRMSRKDIE
jgi:hypothetical protein